MKAPDDKTSMDLIVGQLSLWLDVPAQKIRLSALTKGGGSTADAVLRIGGHEFVVAFKRYPNSQVVWAAADQVLRQLKQMNKPKAIPIVAFPFLGEHLAALAKERGCNWMDLCGNGDIEAPGLRILVQGNPNRYRYAGRPANVFSPKRSRIIRYLVIFSDASYTQTVLAHETGLSRGFTSQIISRLKQEGYLSETDGAYHLKNPAVVLDDWLNRYDFAQHTIIKGQIGRAHV